MGSNYLQNAVALVLVICAGVYLFCRFFHIGPWKNSRLCDRCPACTKVPDKEPPVVALKLPKGNTTEEK